MRSSISLDYTNWSQWRKKNVTNDIYRMWITFPFSAKNTSSQSKNIVTSKTTVNAELEFLCIAKQKKRCVYYNDRPLSEIITVINVVEKFETHTMNCHRSISKLTFWRTFNFHEIQQFQNCFFIILHCRAIQFILCWIEIFLEYQMTSSRLLSVKFFLSIECCHIRY